MSDSALAILGVGAYLPAARPVRAYCQQLGADISRYQGWDKLCLAGDEDHPSTMGAAAMRQALAESGIAPKDIKLVISAGVSRDYPPSWSVATEIMRLCNMPSTCLGLDLTIGCLGSLTGLDFAFGWLATHGGGYAAVVSAERWSYTVDHTDEALRALWAHADGAGVVLVAMNTPARALAYFRGAEFSTNSDYNDHILIKYGGTRYPKPPPGDAGPVRQVAARPRSEVRDKYHQGYSAALRAMTGRFRVHPHRLICNQISPQIVTMISQIAEVPPERTVITGHETGHLGAVDVMLGLRQLLEAGPLDGPVAMVASTAYAFGAGLITSAD